MALEQADVALAQLAGADGGDARKAVHETRKAIKRLRTIVRLLAGELGAEACAREQATLRAAAGHLAGARDAEVMLDTLDALVARRPRKLGGRPGVVRLRRHLLAERDEAERRMLEPRNRMRVRRRTAPVPRPRRRLGAHAAARHRRDRGRPRSHLPAGPPAQASRERARAAGACARCTSGASA